MNVLSHFYSTNLKRTQLLNQSNQISSNQKINMKGRETLKNRTFDVILDFFLALVIKFFFVFGDFCFFFFTIFRTIYPVECQRKSDMSPLWKQLLTRFFNDKENRKNNFSSRFQIQIIKLAKYLGTKLKNNPRKIFFFSL